MAMMMVIVMITNRMRMRMRMRMRIMSSGRGREKKELRRMSILMTAHLSSCKHNFSDKLVMSTFLSWQNFAALLHLSLICKHCHAAN